MVLSFDTFNGKFSYRVAGIAIKDNKILLTRPENGEHWFLPGGRVELGESSTTSLKREFLEEIKAEISIGKLRFLVENFFEQSRKIFHEIGLYFSIDLPISTETTEFYGEELYAKEISTKLIFHWFSPEELVELNFKPEILKDKLFDLNYLDYHLIQME